MTWVRIVSLLVLLSLHCSQSFAEHEAPGSARLRTQGEGAKAVGLFKTGNAKLNKTLSSYSLGKVASAENLAVVTIQSTVPVEASGKYVSLDEALKKRLLTVEEVSSAGSVPTLKVTSHADSPIFLPFGSILTGGRQDRMLREDVVLQPKETRKISVYCIEQGRWRRKSRTRGFIGSSQVAPQSLKRLGKAQYAQGAIWHKVNERNKALDNPSRSGNIQENLGTAAFRKLAKQLEGVREAVAKHDRVCGALVILDGRVVGTEVFAGEAYFKKVWPQLFNSYVIDAASRKETVKTDKDMAKGLAEAFLGSTSSAKVTERSENNLVRFTIESDTCLGDALIESGKGRLVYLGVFPRPKEPAFNMNRQRTPQTYQQRPRQSYRQGRRESPRGYDRATLQSASPRGARGLTAGNVAESIGNDKWNWTVFIKGNAQDLKAIKCVQYTLHPTFPNPVRLVCDAGGPERPFGLSATGWGTFTIGIRLFMKDGSHKDMEHELKF